MLRLLIVLMAAGPLLGYAQTNTGYIEPDVDLIEAQKNRTSRLLKQIDAYANESSNGDGSNSHSEPDELVLQQQRSTADADLQKVEREFDANHQASSVNVPMNTDHERTSRYMADVFSASQDQSFRNSAPSSNAPVVLVSFSMPESQIKSLLEEAKRINAFVVIRGLIDDDFDKTIRKIKALSGEKVSGVAIDPTLFRRFNVTTVPTFILPLRPIESCLKDVCEVPPHVRATGSATFTYFLETVVRLGDQDERLAAQSWLAGLKSEE